MPPAQKPKTWFTLPERLTLQYMRNNIQDVGFLTLLFLTLVVIFVIRACQFKDFKNIDGSVCWAVIIARGCGEFGKEKSFVIVLKMEKLQASA